MATPDKHGWFPIETIGPDQEFDRILVAGWQKRVGTCAAYWWAHEDNVFHGKPDEHPDALLWQPFPKLPSKPPVGA
jgi:hypothetical protein